MSKSMKNSNYSFGNPTRDLRACIAVPHANAPPCFEKLIETVSALWETIRKKQLQYSYLFPTIKTLVSEPGCWSREINANTVAAFFLVVSQSALWGARCDVMWCDVLQAATRLRAMNSCTVLLTSALLVGAILILSVSHTAASPPLSR